MPTWDTATDWDNAQSSQYVVHESVADTDHVNDDWYYQGYNYTSPEIAASSLQGFYPLHEDSGSVAHDVSNDNDLNTYNVVKGDGGILRGSSYYFDGTSSYCQSIGPVLPDVTFGGFALVAWVKTDVTSQVDRIAVNWSGDDADSWVSLENVNGDFAIGFRSSTGSFYRPDTGTTIGDNSWHMIVATFDLSTEELNAYVDGTNVGTYSNTEISDDWLFTSESSYLTLGCNGDQAYFYDGNISNVFVYDVDLISSSADTLYNTVTGTGTYTTSKKSL